MNPVTSWRRHRRLASYGLPSTRLRRARRLARLARRAWRWRWHLAPVAAAAAVGAAAWICAIAMALGTDWLVTAASVTYVLAAGIWARFGLTRTADRLHLAAAVTWAVALTHAVTYVWLPWGAPGWARLGNLAVLTAIGWLPLAVPYWRHHRIRDARALGRHRDAWNFYADGLGIPGSRLRFRDGISGIERDGQRIGMRLRVKGRPGQTAADVATGDKARSVFDLPVGGTVTAVEAGTLDEHDTRSTARDIVIDVIRTSPWRHRTAVTVHPLMAVLDELEAAYPPGAAAPRTALSGPAAAWAPGGRTITEPVPVASPATGGLFGLVFWDPEHGAHNHLIAGVKGSGKGVLLNNVFTGVVPCHDARLTVIDNSEKAGKDAYRFGAAVHLVTSYTETVTVLEDKLELIKTRSARSARHGTDHLHVPTAAEPLEIIVVDELASSTANIRQGKVCGYILFLLTEIARLGRSDGVCLLLAAQSPDTDCCPQGLKRNLDARIQLPVASRRAAQACLEHNYRNVTVPLAEVNKSGEFVGVDFRGLHTNPIRAFSLVKYPLLTRIGALYGDAAHRPAGTQSRTAGAVSLAKAPPTPEVPAVTGPTSQPSPTPPPDDPAPSAAVARATALFANLPTPPAEPPEHPAAPIVAAARNRLDQLHAEFAATDAAGPRGVPVPGRAFTARHINGPAPVADGDADLRAVLLRALAAARDAGRPGLRRTELEHRLALYNADRPAAERLPDSAATVLRVLAQLREDTKVTIGGSGPASYWRLTDQDPAPVPDTEPVSV